MHLSHLSLHDFRSYTEVELPLGPGVTAFVGPNGQGKTNLVEAVGYLATLGSHRVAQDAPLVRLGAERAVVRGQVVRGDRALLVELEIVPGRANRARVNRSSQVKPRDDDPCRHEGPGADVNGSQARVPIDLDGSGIDWHADRKRHGHAAREAEQIRRPREPRRTVVAQRSSHHRRRGKR